MLGFRAYEIQTPNTGFGFGGCWYRDFVALRVWGGDCWGC